MLWIVLSKMCLLIKIPILHCDWASPWRGDVGYGYTGCVFEYQNRLVKKSIVGSGSAGKEQIQSMVGILSGAKFDSEHSADALAIAITHSQVIL